MKHRGGGGGSLLLSTHFHTFISPRIRMLTAGGVTDRKVGGNSSTTSLKTVQTEPVVVLFPAAPWSGSVTGLFLFNQIVYIRGLMRTTYSNTYYCTVGSYR